MDEISKLEQFSRNLQDLGENYGTLKEEEAEH